MHSWMNGLRAIPDRIGRAVNSGRQQKDKRSSQPYLDEEGNICQDKMEMMQHVEYDTQIHCKVIPICQYVEQNHLNMKMTRNGVDICNFIFMIQVVMKKHCNSNFNDNIQSEGNTHTQIRRRLDEVQESHNDGNEQQVCHTMTVRKCETSYRPQMTKVKVRVCPNSIDLDKESKETMENR